MGRENHNLQKQIKITLDTLWALRTDDKFYFMQYGNHLLQALVKSAILKNIINNEK